MTTVKILSLVLSVLFAAAAHAQDFGLQADDGFELTGAPGTRIDFHNHITNTSSQTYSIRAIKYESLPVNWNSSLCDSSVCYPPFVDSLVFVVHGNSEVMLDLYFQTDTAHASGNITIRLRDLNDPGTFVDYVFTASTITTSIDHANTVPDRIKLRANYPNPFNPATVIPFEITGNTPSRVQVSIYNILGERVTTLIDRPLSPGHHTVRWDGNNSHRQPMSSGVYFYELRTNGTALTRKMTLIR